MIDLDKARAFASTRGWLVGRSFPVTFLRDGRCHPGKGDDFVNLWAIPHEVDHPIYFRERHRPYRPVAIVAHVYPRNDLASLERWASPELKAELLDDNWYVEGTVGVIYTRRAP